MSFPSTILAQTNDPKEIQKADLDLLDKINQVSTQVASLSSSASSSVGPYVPLLPNPLISGEPSLGTPHPTSDANRTANLVVNTSTNTAGVWSAAVTMTGVPVGAKAAWCAVYGGAGGVQIIAVEAATGYTLSDITSGTNYAKYWHVRMLDGGYERATGILKIHLDANKQFKWCTSLTNMLVQIGSAIDYEM